MIIAKNKFVLPISALLLVAVLLVPFGTNAAVITNGSVLLSDPRPSQTSTYTVSGSGFTTTTPIQCVQLSFNTAADGSGVVPVGMTTASTFDSTTLLTFGSWTVSNPSLGTVRITNATGENPAASGNIVWGGIVNPSAEGTYYGILNTYSDVACSVGVDNTVMAFVTVDGELVQLTIDPTLTFSVNTVASSQLVNGATTTVGSTAGSVNFGNSVTNAANGVSAHDLVIGTNAPLGYTVYIRHTGDLTNGASETIDNHLGTNAVPTVFPAAGTEAWGYTTEDNSLAGGTLDRFTSGGPFWAGFTTSNAAVMDNPAAPSSTETIRVGQQVGVASTTEAGTYQTTLVYTAASVY